MDLDSAIAYIRRSTPALRKLTPIMCDNPDIILAVIKKHGGKLGLQKASSRLRDDIDIIRAAVHNDPDLIYSLDKKWQRNIEVLEAAISNAGCNPMKYVQDDMLHNEEIVLMLINICGSYGNVIPPNMRNNRNIAIAAVNKYAGALEWIDPGLLHDRSVIIAAVSTGCTMADPYKLWNLIPEELREDPMILRTLNTRYFLVGILEKHYHTKAATWLVSRYPRNISSMPCYWSDAAVMLTATLEYPHSISYASNELFSDHKFLIKLCEVDLVSTLPNLERLICKSYKILSADMPHYILMDICLAYVYTFRNPMTPHKY